MSEIVKDKILKLVNEKNDLYRDVSVDNVYMAPPRSVDEETVPGLDFRNTAVELSGVLNRGYRGKTDVYYRRHDLDNLLAGIFPYFRTRAIDLESIVGKVNNHYGLQLETVDIANPQDFPTWDEGELEVTKTYELVVKDTSYGWMGTITIEIHHGNPLLEDTVVVQLLPILTHPDDPDELGDMMSGRLSTYYFDFTPWKDDLVIDPTTQQWANFVRVQEIGKEAGLDYWYNNRVIDMPTDAVPHANTNFERVMIQNYAGGGVSGPLYFHYDVNW